MKVCINAGGTGGHIYPAISLAKFLKTQGDDFFFIGNQDSMEENVAKQNNIKFYPVKNYGVFKNTWKMKKRAVSSSMKSFRIALKYLKAEKPDILVAFGGYVAVPVVLAAYWLKIPVLLHEQNALAGKANRFLARFAKGIALSYANSAASFKGKETRLTGNPRASDIANFTKDAAILEEYGLSQEQPIVYFVMGSLGSLSINKVLIEMLHNYPLENTQIIISGGIKNTKLLERELADMPYIKVFPQVDQVKLLPFVDLVVSRSGATGLAEIMASGTPAILIPSPYVADNHQYYNAKAFVDEKAALMLEEKDLSAERLYKKIKQVLDDEALREKLHIQAKALSYPDATEKIYQWMKEMIHE